MSKLLIKNIRSIINCTDDISGLKSGKEMKHLPVLNDAWLAIENGLIADFGEMKDWPGITDWRDLEVIDAEGKFLFPGWVDSHTHIVFAAPREQEFVDRINGLSYQEIAARGGGILNSANKLGEMDEELLFESSLKRCHEVISMGTTALEIKSGYGLNLESELKMLKVIKRLKDVLPIPIKSTFLGAHAIPSRHNKDAGAYMNEVINEMLPTVADEGLADYVDIFIEEGYFSVDDGRRLLEKANEYGLKGKIHVNQFSTMGGVGLGVDKGCVSVDHLEELSEEDLQDLKRGSTIPVALPSCSFFLGIPFTPARRIIDAGLPLALATDYNPGSTPSGNMNFVVSLACIKMGMTPEEAINAATINGAAALELDREIGTISRAKKANFFLSTEIPSYAHVPYAFGNNPVGKVFVDGVEFG